MTDESGAPPALYFDNAELAEDALDAYARAAALLDAARDAIVRGALAAGVPATRIREMTGVARTTTDRIVAQQGKTVAYPEPPFLEYVVVLRHRASSRGARPRDAGHATTYRMLAQLLDAPPSDLTLVPTEDARLHAAAVEYRHALDRLVAAPPSGRAAREFASGQAEAMRRVIEEMTEIRRQGPAWLATLPADERQALDDSVANDRLQAQAWTLGRPVEEVAAMTEGERATALAAVADAEEEL
jgi:hypothetical protein